MRKLQSILVFTAAFFISSAAMAQVPPPPNSGNSPIDMGILALAAAGVGFGIYRKSRKA